MSHPNPSTAMAVTIVDELVRNGVTRFVICPGSRSTALAVAAAEHPQVDWSVVIDERSAGFWALGMGKATETPAAVVVTSGTAVANLLPAVVEANLSHTPLIVLAADRPAELQEVGANQTIAQGDIFGVQVRRRFLLNAAEDREDSNRLWRSTVSRAVAEAGGAAGPPGPVHLNLAFREPLTPVSDDGRVSAPRFATDTTGREFAAPWTGVVTGLPGYPVKALPDELDTEAGVVVVGDRRLGSAAAMLAHRQGWPLLAEPQSGYRHGGGMVEGGGRRAAPSISTFHHLLGHPGFSQPADVVIRFGRAGLSRNLDLYSATAARRVVVDPWGWSDPGRDAHLLLRAVPLSTRPDGAPVSRWMERWLKAEALARRVVDGVLDGMDLPTEPRVARDVARAAGEGGRLVAASSMPIRDLNMFMEPLRLDVFSNRGGSGIDGFVSTTLGVASTPGPTPVALVGDLSMLHDSNGFLAERGCSAVFVVVNNDGGGIFSFLPPARHVAQFERLFGTPHGRRFADLARLHDLEYTRVERAEGLIPVIGEAVVGGIHLIEVTTDRHTNVDVHRGIAAGVEKALDSLFG